MQTYGCIQKAISRHDTRHQTLICKRYISEEVKWEHSKNKKLPNVFVFEDKAGNIYKMPEQEEIKLLHDNVTKTCKQAPLN